MTGIAERLTRQFDWSTLREANGPACHIGQSLERLLGATSAEDATQRYWELENHIVVQGQVFEAAEASVAVLISALADERPRYVRIAILELVYQVLSGSPSTEEEGAANGALVLRCAERVREGLWLIVREADRGEAAAMDVLGLLLAGDQLKMVESVIESSACL